MRNNNAVIDEAREAEGSSPTQEPYGEFPLPTTILMLGATGTGKSATINAILGEDACSTSATGACTKKVAAALSGSQHLVSVLHLTGVA